MEDQMKYIGLLHFFLPLPPQIALSPFFFLNLFSSCLPSVLVARLHRPEVNSWPFALCSSPANGQTGGHEGRRLKMNGRETVRWAQTDKVGPIHRFRPSPVQL